MTEPRVVATYTVDGDEKTEFTEFLNKKISEGLTIKWASAGRTFRVEGVLTDLRLITDFLNFMRS